MQAARRGGRDEAVVERGEQRHFPHQPADLECAREVHGVEAAQPVLLREVAGRAARSSLSSTTTMAFLFLTFPLPRSRT